MKCTQCGNKEFYKLDRANRYLKSESEYEFGFKKTASRDRGNGWIDVYSCSECGHLEWFNKFPGQKYEKLLATIKELKGYLNQIEPKINKTNSEIQRIEEKIKELEHEQKDSYNLSGKQIQEKQTTIIELKKIRDNLFKNGTRGMIRVQFSDNKRFVLINDNEIKQEINNGLDHYTLLGLQKELLTDIAGVQEELKQLNVEKIKG